MKDAPRQRTYNGKDDADAETRQVCGLSLERRTRECQKKMQTYFMDGPKAVCSINVISIEIV